MLGCGRDLFVRQHGNGDRRPGCTQGGSAKESDRRHFAIFGVVEADRSGA